MTAADMPQEIGIDASIFARAAELLARPLSPTALEKEEAQAAAEKAKPTSTKEKKAQPPPKPAPATSSKAAEPPATASNEAKPVAEAPPPAALEPTAKDASLPEGARGANSISDVVAGLNDFQREMKEKLRSPTGRKQGPPKVRRGPDPRVLSEPERQEKLSEIEALETKLQRAQGKAGVASSRPSNPPATSSTAAAANAAATPKAPSQSRSRAGSVASSQAGSVGSASARGRRGPSAEKAGSEAGDGAGHGRKSSKGSDPPRPSNQQAPASDVENEWKRQAEERVKARKFEEEVARKEQLRKEREEKRLRHEESEARAKELENAARERVQARLRDERKREKLQKEEERRERQEREERAARSEEQRLKARRRAADRQVAEERKALEEATAQAEHRFKQEEESRAKAAELQERTRLRIQQKEQEALEQRLAEEERRRQLEEEEAAAATERHYQQQLSQERAKARAASFKQRQQLEEEERARIAQEREEFDRYRAEQALRDRHQKRQWRTQGMRSESPSDKSSQHSLQQLSVETAAPVEISVASRIHESTAPRKAAPPPPLPDVAPCAPAQQKAAKAPQPLCTAAAEATALPKAKVPPKPPRRGKPASQPTPEPEVEIVEPKWKPTEEAGGALSQDDHGAVRCTVGFFGVGGILDDDEDEEVAADIHAVGRPEPSVGSSAAHGSAAVQPMSRPEQAHEPRHRQKSPKTVMPRAFSQPPPMSRPTPACGSRASSPASSYDAPPVDLPDFGAYIMEDSDGDHCSRVNDASKVRDQDASKKEGAPSPVPRQRAWKQKAIPLQSNDYYLELMKGSRATAKSAASGQAKPTGGKVSLSSPVRVPGPSAWSEGPRGYASQLQRAAVVEAQQQEEADRRMERGFAVLQRVQQRALQASPLRSVSAESGLR